MCQKMLLNMSSFIQTMMEEEVDFDLEVKPTKIVKGQGLERLLAK
jgi:hypothetical protein